jgi:hypothetical protein
MGESLLEKPLVKHCRTKWHNYVNIRGLRHYKRDNRISTVPGALSIGLLVRWCSWASLWL